MVEHADARGDGSHIAIRTCAGGKDRETDLGERRYVEWCT